MDEANLKKPEVLIILGILLILSFLILKPIMLAIVMGIILSVVFTPVYDWLVDKTNAKNISAFIICFLLILIILLPIWFLTPIFIRQSFEVYQFSQQLDFAATLKAIFPSLFASEQFSREIGSVLSSFVTNITNALLNWLSAFLLNFPLFFLQLVIVFFTLFFILRDKEKLIDYIRTLSPFSKNIEDKLFKSSREITVSVIYGQVLIGIVQGLIAGIGFFIFGVNNALFLTLIASLSAIFPIVGTAIVWIPVTIYLIIGGNTGAAIGVLIFGILSSTIDNILRPLFVSKRTRIHPLVLIIGMIGGLLFFGIIGFILGPLILAYVIIILEIFEGNSMKGPVIVIQKN